MNIDNLLTNFEREIFLNIADLRAAGIPPLLIDGVLSQVSASLRMDLVLTMTGRENELENKIKQLEAERIQSNKMQTSETVICNEKDGEEE